MNNEQNNEINKNMSEMSSVGQFIPSFRKRTGGIADIIAMIITYILTAELIASLLLSNFLNFTWHTTVVYFLFFITATAYIVSKKKELSMKAIPYGAAALILSLSFSLHQNSGLNALTLLAIMILSGIYCITLTKSGVHSLSSYFSLIDILRCEFTLPLKNIFVPYPAMIRGIRTGGKPHLKKPDKKWLYAALGVVLAIPVLIIIVPLLIEGDAAFGSLFTFVDPMREALSKFFDKFSDYIFSSEKLLCYFAALFISPYIFSVMFSFRHGINREENRDTSEKYIKMRKAPQSLAVPFLAVICVVYAVYLLSQTAYFFSAFTGHLPSGVKITVTEYARQGFFEMMKIAVINLILIALTVLFSKRRNGRLTGAVKALDIFLCVFTIIISSTSLSKIILYINRFGLTQKRVYVFVFDIVLILAFLSVILRFFISRFPYMKIIIASVCVAFMLICVGGADKFICDKNAELYLSGRLESIDVSVMEYMSPASVGALVKIAESDKPAAPQARIYLMEIRKNYAYYSYTAAIDRNGKISEDASFDSLEEYNAVKMLCDYFSEEVHPTDDSDHTAFIHIAFYGENVMSLSVTTDKETLALQNADGSPLERGKPFVFDIDTTDTEKFTYTMTLDDGEAYTFESKSNFIMIDGEWNDELQKDCYYKVKELDRLISTDEAFEFIETGEISPR